MPQANEFTEIVHLLKDEITGAKKTARKANPIPFGQERVKNKAAAMARFLNLSPEEKRAYIQEQGLENVMKMVRGKSNG